MRRALLVLPLAAAALGAWALLRRTPPAAPGDDPAAEVGEAVEVAAPRRAVGSTPLAGSGWHAEKERRAQLPVEGVIRHSGSARIVLRAPEGEEASPSSRIDVEALGPALVLYPLPVRDEDGTWVYESLPVGRYRFRALVPGYEVATVEAKVGVDRETRVEVPLAKGGEIAFRARLLSGEAPESIRLAVLDGRGQPVAYSIQLPAGIVHVTGAARRAEPELPAEGKVVGLRPGTYRVRATSAASESAEQPVEVRPGEAVALELTIRR